VSLIKRQIRRATSSPAKPLKMQRCGVAASAARPMLRLHLPAIAHECGIKFDLFDVPKILQKTPYVADLKARWPLWLPKTCFEQGASRC
jgi:dihydroxy-acid dehydratase